MKNVFYQLFDEDLSRVNLVFEKGSAYEAATNRLVAEEDKLQATMTDKQKQLLRAYSKAESDVFDIARREDFAAGVRLGARLMLAILDDTPAMVHPEIKESQENKPLGFQSGSARRWPLFLCPFSPRTSPRRWPLSRALRRRSGSPSTGRKSGHVGPTWANSETRR